MCKTPENLKYNENDALRMNTKPEMMTTSNGVGDQTRNTIYGVE